MTGTERFGVRVPGVDHQCVRHDIRLHAATGSIAQRAISAVSPVW